MSELPPLVGQRLPQNIVLTNAQLAGMAGRQTIVLRQEALTPYHARGITQQTPWLIDQFYLQATATNQTPVLPGVGTLPDVRVIDLQGDWVSLGGVDLQINGALGLAFPDLTMADGSLLQAICHTLWQQGVDGFLPTIVTTRVDKIHRALAAIADWMAKPPIPKTAQILGVHLEGPCLNPEKRGAHPAAYLQPLTLDTVKTVLGDYAAIVKVMTLAPELDPTGTVIPYLRSLGITVSLGHSQATADQARTAFAQGASMVTHAFNAMPGLHHREPGLLGAALTTPGVTCGVIADGQHLCPTMLDLLLRMTATPRTANGDCDPLFLVSDALAPLGLPDGIYPWDDRPMTVTQGTARLADGTLAGTTLPLLAGVQNLVQWGLCDPARAIALATTTPRAAIGLPGWEMGQPASLLRWHRDLLTGQLHWQRLLEE
ncbi:N-acetylglucosamine-6-phosphate deacetylase [Trichothermofontia sichuanensis B231]|uniref:N-acetylglucosamine-6-phosphate deacetylase n=1 Tax=Trichothermofontia sichuanensis TaxID=3045816 RepID=UPI0022466F2B|nr:N-acetylglucosamine-6-phosphate deacetylase [Trichothermofontia sichuanensis]UZQ55923.1 N-acetylglucosamine-6-phosphate deacetylase [Trichothermofontia sichuanensis B231]